MASSENDVIRQDFLLEELSPFLKCDKGMYLLFGQEDIRVYRILPVPNSSDIKSLSTVLGISLVDTTPEALSVLQWGERMFVWDTNIVDLTFSYLSQLNDTDQLQSATSMKTILNSSNKLLVTPTLSPPYSGICHISSVYPSGAVIHGTGWLASNFLVITSGYMFYSKLHGGSPSEIRISPGKDGNISPCGEIVVKDKRCILLPRSWEYIGNTEYVGVLMNGITSKLSNCFKWKTAALSSAQADYTLSIAGYATCGTDSYRMYMTGIQVESLTPDKIYYRYVTAGRECGAPVWAILDEPGVFHVVGIQDPVKDQLYASATRLTHTLLAEIDHWNLSTDVLNCVNECEYNAASDKLIKLHQDGYIDLFHAVIAVLNSSFDIFKIGFNLIDFKRDTCTTITGTQIVRNYFDQFVADILLTSRDEFRCFHLHRVEDYSRLSLTVLPNRLLGDNLRRCAMFHGGNRPNYSQGGNIRIRPYFQNGILLYFHLERVEDGSRVSLSGSLAPLGENESRCARYHKRDVENYSEGGNLLIIPVPGSETCFHIHRFEDRSRLALSGDANIGADQWGCAKFVGKKVPSYNLGGNIYISSFKIVA